MVAYRSLFAMGTRMEIVLPGIEDELADRIFIELKNQVLKDEQLLSIYSEDSVFSIINKNAANTPWQIDRNTFNLIKSLISYNDLTLGFFDFSLGIIKKELFHSSPETLKNILSTEFIQRIKLDESNSTIHYQIPGVKIDSGGFGKGFTLDTAKKILLSYKIKNAFISFGDSMVMTLGSHPAGDHWKIGIKDLVDDQKNVSIFEINDGFVSTSGNTKQNRIKSEQGHIINPLSGDFVNRFSVVSVQGPSALEAEILSTALFIAGGDQRKKILKNFEQFNAVELVYIKENNQTQIIELK